MCTVSVIALPGFDGGFRLACNRDELLTRPPARPPEVRIFGERRAVMPVDPASNGTWVAVNDAGVAMVLLNVNPIDGCNVVGRASRGRIIPSLLHCDAADDAIAAAAATIDARRHPPFRLVVVDGRRWGEMLSDGSQSDVASGAFDGTPLFFTSSSLGDALVDPPRRALFDRMVRCAPHRQDEFHTHAWPDRPHLSVRMSRGGARTVSRTVIEVASAGATTRYVADDADRVTRLELSCIQTT